MPAKNPSFFRRVYGIRWRCISKMRRDKALSRRDELSLASPILWIKIETHMYHDSLRRGSVYTFDKQKYHCLLYPKIYWFIRFLDVFFKSAVIHFFLEPCLQSTPRSYGLVDFYLTDGFVALTGYEPGFSDIIRYSSILSDILRDRFLIPSFNSRFGSIVPFVALQLSSRFVLGCILEPLAYSP